MNFSFKKILLRTLVLFLAITNFIFPFAQIEASTPSILSYQGRLTNDDGDLLGGASGTAYFFKFSFWDTATVDTGSRVWPSSAPNASSITVKQGVFNVKIGDTDGGYPDTMDYNFNSDNTVYLQVEVSANNVTFETLGPRQQITSPAYADTAGSANSVSGAGQSSFGTTTSTANSVVTVQATSSASTALTLLASAGQTANIFNILDASNNSLFSINNSGGLTINSATSTNLFASFLNSTNSVFTNSTSTNLFSTNLAATNFTLSNLSGVLFGTNGVVSSIATSTLFANYYTQDESDGLFDLLGSATSSVTNHENIFDHDLIATALQSFTESDPIFMAASTTLAYQPIGSYLTAESDPAYTGSSWFGTTNNSTDWNTAFGWGDHSTAGYLESLSGALLATGATTGATSQAQTFTNGVITGKVYPSADSTSAFGIFKANGTTNVLNVDTTNGRVGIGTSTPLTPLQIETTGGSGVTLRRGGIGAWEWTIGTSGGSGSTGNALIYRPSTAAGGSDGVVAIQNAALGSVRWFVQSSNGDSYQFGKQHFGNGTADFTVGRVLIDSGATGTKGLIVRGHSGQTANLQEWQDSTGTVLSVVNASGNVGVGTSTPAAKLDVWGNLNVGTSSTPTFFVNTATRQVGIATSNPGAELEVNLVSGNTDVRVRYDSTKYFDFTSASAAHYLWGYGAIPLSFGTNGTEKMRITSAGDIGIGTTTPFDQLDVSKSTSGGLGGRMVLTNSAARANGNFVDLGFKTNSNYISGWYSSLISSIQDSGATDGSSLAFNTNDGGTARGTEKLRITSTGNIGIGTTTPQSKLTVALNNTTGTPLEFTGGGTRKSGYLYSDTAGVGLFDTSGGGLGEGIYLNKSSVYVSLYTGASERMRVDSSGNVGIGTTNPVSKFTVGAASAALTTMSGATGFAFSGSGGLMGVENTVTSSADGSGGAVGVYMNDGAAPISGDRLGLVVFGGSSSASALRNSAALVAYSSQNWVDGSAYGTDFAFETITNGATTRTEKMRLTNDGNLGIGTSTPTAKLDVWGNLTVGTSSTPTLFVNTATGNVGIGTTTPSTKLDINGVVRISPGTGGDYNDGIRVNDSTADYAGLFLGGTRISGTTADMWSILKNPSNNLEIRNNASVLMTVLASGNVGIGTTLPTNILSLGQGADRTFWVERNATTHGDDLTIQAGGAASGIADKMGGNLYLRGGVSTGNVGSTNSGIIFETSRGSVSGVSDAAFTTRMKINGRGAVLIGSGAGGGLVNSGLGGLDVSYGGSPATFILGGDNSATTRTDNTDKVFRIAGAPYSTSEEAVAVLVGTSLSSANTLSWGGGTGVLNAATIHNFYTAADSITPTGTVRMSINSAGNVGIGTSPSVRFHVLDTAEQVRIGYDSSNYYSTTVGSTGAVTFNAIGAGAGFSFSNNVGIGTSTPTVALAVVGNGQFTAVTSGAYATDLNLTSDGTLTTSASDIRLKTNLEPLGDLTDTNMLDKVLQLKPYTFNWKSEPNGKKDIGLIAQDVENIFPEITFTNNTDGYKGVNYSRLAVILVSAIQELNSQVIKMSAYVVDGVATFAEVVSNKITAKEQICIGETCVDEQMLKELLEKNSVTSTPSNTAPTDSDTPSGEEVIPTEPTPTDTPPEENPENASDTLPAETPVQEEPGGDVTPTETPQEEPPAPQPTESEPAQQEQVAPEPEPAESSPNPEPSAPASE